MAEQKITITIDQMSIDRLARAIAQTVTDALSRTPRRSGRPGGPVPPGQSYIVAGEYVSPPGLEPIVIYAPRERQPLFLFIDTENNQEHWTHESYGKQQPTWRQAWFRTEG